jgi:hypothetical protein
MFLQTRSSFRDIRPEEEYLANRGVDFILAIYSAPRGKSVALSDILESIRSTGLTAAGADMAFAGAGLTAWAEKDRLRANAVKEKGLILMQRS